MLPVSGSLIPRTSNFRSEVRSLLGFAPPAGGEDPELEAVADELLAADPSGDRFGGVLRATYDQLLDGQRTGRWDWMTLRKTEKTHMGTLVEINLHREFDFRDGADMDYEIAGADVDCKFSQRLGGWEIPPEASGHLCLLVWANEDHKRWEAGIMRVTDSILGPPNRDGKRKLTPAGESQVRWIWPGAELPENLLLLLPEAVRKRIFEATGRGGRSSGQARINMLFRLVQQRLIRRPVVLTVGRQDDAPKRARDARLPQHLGGEGILVLGHQEDDPQVARALGVPVPRKGQWVSVRVHPAEPGWAGPGAVLGGKHWRVAKGHDPVIPAPQVRT